MEPSSSTAAESRLICLVCRKQFSHYTCPRCNVRYCSLPCYRSHSSRCLESFNRDNVLANMQDCVATPETRRRMLEALQRSHHLNDATASDDDLENGDGDSDEDGNHISRRPPCILSESTLSKLAEGKDIQIGDLSPEEQKAFLRALTAGEFSHMIKPWEPWWLSPFANKIALTKEGQRKVRPIVDSDTKESDPSDVPPPLDGPLPSLKDLTPKPPSPLLGIHLVEVLYSYCFTLRFFNGDWTCDAFSAAWTCLSISHVLGISASPQTVGAALNDCFATICSPYFKSAGGLKFAVALLDDAIALLHIGRSGVICALSDLHRMLEMSAKDAKQGSACRKSHQQFSATIGVSKTKASSSSELKAISKKVFFLLCWANEQLPELFSAYASGLENEKARVMEIEHRTVNDNGKSIGKPLVEELMGTT